MRKTVVLFAACRCLAGDALTGVLSGLGHNLELITVESYDELMRAVRDGEAQLFIFAGQNEGSIELTCEIRLQNKQAILVSCCDRIVGGSFDYIVNVSDPSGPATLRSLVGDFDRGKLRPAPVKIGLQELAA